MTVLLYIFTSRRYASGAYGPASVLLFQLHGCTCLHCCRPTVGQINDDDTDDADEDECCCCCIPVEADCCQVKNGRRATEHVERNPRVAEDISETPARVVHLCIQYRISKC